MKKERVIACMMILNLFLISSCSLSNAPEEEEQNDCIEFRGEIREETLYSNWVNDDFKIYIYLPENYAQSGTEEYPAIYQLDADPDHLVTSKLVSRLSCMGVIPPVIVIGIGYPTFTDHRYRDLFYPYDKHYPTSGGGLNFYNFIKDELIPFIDTNFRTDNTTYGRTIMGHSAGGYFVMFALFRYRNLDTDHLKNFVAASPYLAYHDNYIFELEKLFATPPPDPLPVNFYTTIGGLEGGHYEWGKMVSILAERAGDNPGFNVKSKEFADLLHTETNKPSYEAGLLFIFK